VHNAVLISMIAVLGFREDVLGLKTLVLVKTSGKRSFSLQYVLMNNVFSSCWILAWFWKWPQGEGEINSRHIVRQISKKNSEFSQLRSSLQNYEELLKHILYITRRPIEQRIGCLYQILTKWIFTRLYLKIKIFSLYYLLRVHWLVYFNWAPPPPWVVFNDPIHSSFTTHQRQL